MEGKPFDAEPSFRLDELRSGTKAICYSPGLLSRCKTFCVKLPAPVLAFLNEVSEHGQEDHPGREGMGGYSRSLLRPEANELLVIRTTKRLRPGGSLRLSTNRPVQGNRARANCADLWAGTPPPHDRGAVADDAIDGLQDAQAISAPCPGQCRAFVSWPAMRMS